MGGVRHLGWGMDHEAEPVHARADHRDFARAGGWGKDGRRLPQAREASAVLADWNHDYNTSDRTVRSAIYRRPNTPIAALPKATARRAALRRGLRAPSRCFAEPTRLKSTRDSAHNWMKVRAQVMRRES